MPEYVIEREIAGAGQLTSADLQGISASSCKVLNELGPSIQWVQSYVTEDRIYCVYIAPDEAVVREHARRGGFPANKVSEIRTTIDPTTAEAVG
jgi:cell division inhibitor SulA